MQPLYENIENNLEIYHKRSRHISPHIHKSLECILVTAGTLELGIGTELYHMDTNDFAIVFPDIIHHYQVFSSQESKAIYLMASPVLSGGYLQTLQQFCPQYPVIPGASLHPDIRYAINSLLKDPHPDQSDTIYHAYIQLILARSLPAFQFIDKSSMGSDDIIYQTVSYIAGHFMEKVTLTDMAHNLGVSPYALSRVFSKTFHSNFNQYLNSTRLDYACSLLRQTNLSITEICMNSGFDSQRTFNRVFKEQLRLSPREYRSRNHSPD